MKTKRNQHKTKLRVKPDPGYDWLCLRCGHQWRSRKPPTPKTPKPICCSKCRSAYWDRPKHTKHRSNNISPDLVHSLLHDGKAGSTEMPYAYVPLSPPPSLKDLSDIHVEVDGKPLSMDEITKALEDLNG